MNDYELSKILHRLADAVSLAGQLSSQHNCNDCGISKMCEYTPKLGGLVRINCPLWKGEKDE